MRGKVTVRNFFFVCLSVSLFIANHFPSRNRLTSKFLDLLSSIMAEATLTYFDIRGRAELARLVLEHSGTKYNDKRVTFEEWPEVSICRDHRTFCKYFLAC
tara:strand:- start:947 stop:1249 length:303 start_codon:yes stop_codon:yes gene_type:complete